MKFISNGNSKSNFETNDFILMAILILKDKKADFFYLLVCKFFITFKQKFHVVFK